MCSLAHSRHQGVVDVEMTINETDSTSCITEIVISNESWRLTSDVCDARATIPIVPNLIRCCSKGPDMLSGMSMGDTNAINIILFYCRIRNLLETQSGRLVSYHTPYYIEANDN